MTPSPRHIIASPRPLQSLLAEIDNTSVSCSEQPVSFEQLQQQKFQISQRLLATSDIHYEMTSHYATARNKRNAARNNSGFSTLHSKDVNRMFSMESILSSLAIQVTQFENNASSGDEEQREQNATEKADGLDADDDGVLDVEESSRLLEQIDATKELTAFVDAKLLAAENAEQVSKSQAAATLKNNQREFPRMSSSQPTTSERLRAVNASRRLPANTIYASRPASLDNPILRRNALDEILGVRNDDEVLLISDGENVCVAEADDLVTGAFVKVTKTNGTNFKNSNSKRDLDDVCADGFVIGDDPTTSAFPTARINRLSQPNKRKKLEKIIAVASGDGNEEARVPPEKLSYFRTFKKLNADLSDVERKLGFRYGVFGPFASVNTAGSVHVAAASQTFADCDKDDMLLNEDQWNKTSKPASGGANADVDVDADKEADADDEAEDADSTVATDSEDELVQYGTERRSVAADDDES